MERVQELINEIRGEGNDLKKQQCSSSRDEIRFMRSMLNDRDYKVGVYGNAGKIGEICPAQEARDMIASVISSAAKIPQAEAENLSNNYEFKKNEATSMVNISKEFVNSYLHTGRKLPLGGRERSNISLSLKEVEAKEKKYPVKTDEIGKDGKPVYKNVPTMINAHETISVKGSCPKWLK